MSYKKVKEIFDFSPLSEGKDEGEKKEIKNIGDPKVWGPPFWFSLHVTSRLYPESPTVIAQTAMYNRILSIPYEIPCQNCRKHAHDFISNYGDLSNVVKTRKSLFAFYVDFHNKVNERFGKPLWSFQQAWNYYSPQG